MCFSASASLITSALLFPAGIYGIYRALKVNKHYLLFSCIPLFFAIQQFIEGLIWMQLNANHPEFAHTLSYIYLFFAYGFWPIFISLSVFLIETDKRRRQCLFYLILVGGLLCAVSYLPILFGVIPFTTSIVEGSITYYPIYPDWVVRFYSITYLFILLLALFLTTKNHIKIFGLMMLVSFVISMIWFLYAFTSIWCYFAAILSFYLVYVMHILQSDR